VTRERPQRATTSLVNVAERQQPDHRIDTYNDLLLPVPAVPASICEVHESTLRLRQPGLAERLESGEILLFRPGLLNPLPSEEDLRFLRDELGALLSHKNMSYHPDGGFLTGIRRDPARKRRLTRILHDHNLAVQEFLKAALPEYSGEWRLGKVNFRPIQERGRDLPRHQSNERIHVDAFPSGATHGDRVLRFFTNIHPAEPRVWKSAGLFPELFQEFGVAAGLTGRPVSPGPFGRAFSGMLRGLAKIGLPQAELVDTSPYDRSMLKLHDHLKDDDAFQADARRWVFLEFPPFSSWAVMTDMVSHAVISGQHALVNTFYVKLARCRKPELAPFHVMAQASLQ
jgi:hypothetical protein